MFMAMCRRVCGLPLEEGEEYPDMSMLVKQVTEERATRTLYRIELLRKVREQVLCHPQLEDHLRLCQPSPDLPDWWESGRHDLELLTGAARHGVSRTDCHLMNDPELSFRACHLNYLQSLNPGSRSSTPLLPQYQATRTASPLPLSLPLSLPSHPPERSPALVDHRGLEEDFGCPAGLGSRLGMCPGDFRHRHRHRHSPPEPRSPPEKQRAPPATMATATDWDKESDSESDKSSSPGASPSLSDVSDDEKDPDDKPGSEAPSHSKTYDEESMISVNTSRDETQDGFMNEDLDPSLGDFLQDKPRYPSSCWPKDRVLINRIDVVCQAVLTGRWPTPGRAQCDPGAVPGDAPCTPSLMGSPGDSPVPTPGSLTIDEDLASAQFTKVKKHIREKEFTVKINN
ncbi:chromodomain-helicase-DNA-binding protein 8-like, partial [Cetorhinus maximus]